MQYAISMMRMQVRLAIPDAAAGVEGKFIAYRKGVHELKSGVLLCSCWHAVCTGPNVAYGSLDGPEQCTTKRKIVGCKWKSNTHRPFFPCNNVEPNTLALSPRFFAWESVLA